MVVGGARAGVGGKTWVAPKIKDMDEKKGKHDLRAILQVCFYGVFLGGVVLFAFFIRSFLDLLSCLNYEIEP